MIDRKFSKKSIEDLQKIIAASFRDACRIFNCFVYTYNVYNTYRRIYSLDGCSNRIIAYCYFKL